LKNSAAPILVTGAHRTGTTWVGKMLAASGEAGYISEPLNTAHRPGVLRVPVKYWYTYICDENESNYLPAMQEMLHFRYHPWSEIRSLNSSKDLGRMGRDGLIFLRGWLTKQRPLIKDPFALFSIPWFIQRLACQVVVTVRHPAAFASSLKRLNWSFEIEDLLAQPMLIRDWLSPFQADMEDIITVTKAEEASSKASSEAYTTIIDRASLLWRAVYQVVDNMRQKFPQIQVVRHEDLSLDPLSSYRALYDSLELNFTPAVQKAIQQASSAENPKEVSQKKIFSTHLDSRANLENWKRRLTPQEVGRVRQMTEPVAALYYPDFTWD
jgi:hypothetical protein